MLNTFIAYILRFHKHFIAASVIATVALFFWFAKIKIAATHEGYFPPKGDPEYEYFQKAIKTFGSNYYVIIAINGNGSVFSYPMLEKIGKLTSKYEKLPTVKNVASLTSAVIIKSRHDEILLKDISDSIPSTEAGIQKFREDILGNPLYESNLVSKDEHSTIIYVAIDENAPREASRKTIDQIRQIAAAEFGAETIYITGEAMFDSLCYQKTWDDIRIFVPLIILLIALIVYLNFRNVWCVILSIAYIIIALEWTYSIMSISNVSISLLTASFLPVVAVVGISNSVHFFTEYFRWRSQEKEPRQAVKETLQDVLLPIWLKLLTTAIGFSSLALVNVEAIKRMGVFLTVGVVSILLLITFFIPSIIILFTPKLSVEKQAELI